MNDTTTYELHDLCLLFPPMGAEDLAALAADIAENGLQQAIVLYEGKILDGRNRYLACPPDKLRTTNNDGDSPISFVVSQNLARRNLTSSQCALVAHDLLPGLNLEAKARQRQGGATLPDPEKGKAVDIAARLTGTSGRSVQDVKKVKATVPALVEFIRAGDLK